MGEAGLKALGTSVRDETHSTWINTTCALAVSVPDSLTKFELDSLSASVDFAEGIHVGVSADGIAVAVTRLHIKLRVEPRCNTFQLSVHVGELLIGNVGADYQQVGRVRTNRAHD